MNYIKINITNFKNNFHLLLLGIAFTVFLFGTVMPLFYNFFIENKFFELYILIIYVFFFVAFSLPIGIVFIVKKDYEALKHISILYLLIVIVSYLGLTISLLISPILVGYGVYYNFSSFITRGKSTSTSI
jgi:hypothetical protein